MADEVKMTHDETVLMVILYGAFLMNDLTTDYVVQARSLLSKTPHWKHQLKRDVNMAADACRYFHLREETRNLRRQLFEFRNGDDAALFIDADNAAWQDANFGESTDRFRSFVNLHIEDTLRNWYENEYIRLGAPFPRAYSFLNTAYTLCCISCNVIDTRMKQMERYPWANRQRWGAVFFDEGNQTKQVLAKLLKMETVRVRLKEALAGYIDTYHIHHDHEEHVQRTEKVIRLFAGESNILNAADVNYVRS